LSSSSSADTIFIYLETQPQTHLQDYEVFRDTVGTKQRWLFINNVPGEDESSNKSSIDLENYVRRDAANPKKGEVLWRAKYDEDPHYKQQYDSDSSSDGFSSDGFMNVTSRKLQMKWRLSTKATIKSIKYPGQEFKIKVKAKGWAQRVVSVVYNEETGAPELEYDDCEKVKKISYKIVNKATGETIDTFKIKGMSRGGALQWKCGAFNSTLEGGWFSRGNTDVLTTGGVDPGFSLLMAHICSSEFGPEEIKADLKPNWMLYFAGGWNPASFLMNGD